MKDNDLSAEPTRRYWVTADVVFLVIEASTEEKSGWFRKTKISNTIYVPNLKILSMLWQWSARLGVRLELIFVGDLAAEAGHLWMSLEAAANPFTENFVFSSVDGVHALLPYRPDLMGIIDTPERSAMWGSKGLTTESLR